LKEGAHINKSLLTLGTVIKKLSKQEGYVVLYMITSNLSRGHIPYRDSKLTRILQPALGGNSRTAIICTVTPAAIHCEETHSTLKFASRAKTITNKPMVNEVLDDQAMLKRLQKEVANLKKQLSSMKEGALEEEMKALQMEKQMLAQDKEQMQQLLEQQESIRKAQAEKMERMAKMILVSSHATSNPADKVSFKQARSRRETWCPGKPLGFGGAFPMPFSPAKKATKKAVAFSPAASPICKLLHEVEIILLTNY
jgi:centromeric protein E